MLRHLTKTFLLILLLVEGVINIGYAETKVGLETFKIDPETNIELTSQSMTFDNQKGQADFFDDVVVEYGRLKLFAQKLSFIKSKSTKELNHFTFSASGKIKISDGSNIIYGDSADFNSKKNELIIRGNVRLNQNNNIINGEKLILNLQKGIARISGSVKTVISPTGKTNDSQ